MLLNVNNQKGFTIIELALVIIVVGIMLGMYIKIYTIWKESKDFYAVENNLDNVTEAIFAYRSEYGRYPCPSDSTLNPGDANYGQEDCSLTVVAGANPLVPGANVMIGHFPLYDNSVEPVTMASLISKLKLEGSNLNDPWNQHFIYAVSEDLTSTLTFDAEAGAIGIVDESGVNTGGTNGDAHFVLLSRGMDARCAGRGFSENENCNGDAIFSNSLLSTNENTILSYYDDFVRFKRSPTVGIWTNRIEGGSPTDDIFPMIGGKLHVGNTGYELAPALTNIRLDVEGNILSEDRLAANLICDDTAGTNCFQPESLFNIECPISGQYIKEVSIDGAGNLNAVCGDLGFVPTTFNCTNGDYLKGIYTDGTGISCERWTP